MRAGTVVAQRGLECGQGAVSCGLADFEGQAGAATLISPWYPATVAARAA
jgi:hypothetical protein